MFNTSEILFDQVNADNISDSFNVSSTHHSKEDTEEVGCAVDDRNNSPATGYASFTLGVFLISENLLMISVICRHRALHTNANILVVSLAFSDVMIGVQCCIMGLDAHPTGFRSWSGFRPFQLRIFYAFITGANFSLVIVSMVHIAVLSVDRYLYVLWPLQYHRRVTQQRVIMTAFAIWTMGCTYMILPLVFYVDPKYHVTCIISDPPLAYASGPLVGVYSVCLIVVIVSTLRLAMLARDHGRRRGILKTKSTKTGYSDTENGKVKFGQRVSVAVIASRAVPTLVMEMNDGKTDHDTDLESNLPRDFHYIEDNLVENQVHLHFSHGNAFSWPDIKQSKLTKTEKNRKLLQRTKMKILKFVLIILGCYLGCTVPSILSLILTDFVQINRFPRTVEQVCGLLLVSNSGMNFIIMTVLNKEFRAALLACSSCGKVCSKKGQNML